jgi:Fe-Mn family superoxide dismutase
VNATNTLNEHIVDNLEDGNVDQEEMPAYSELTRRLGFKYNGMVLHELYFENLTSQESSDPQDQNSIERAITKSFGSFEDGLYQHRKNARRRLGDLLSKSAK